MKILDYLKQHIRLIIITGIVLFVALWCVVGFNQKLEVTAYTIKSNEIPVSFDGFRIVQLSDLHCQEFGDRQSELVKKISDLKPDIIILTGDIIDGYHSTIDASLEAIQKLSDLYPVYAVNGNHEKDRLSNYLLLRQKYQEYSVVELNDTSTKLTHEDGSLYLYGSDWYTTSTAYNIPDAPKEEAFTILLYHDASLFHITSQKGYDLILSGHVHGGVIRLPIIGGILGPNRSIFPMFSGGKYTENNAILISNRGLGEATPPIPRFYNRPEIALITLRSE